MFIMPLRDSMSAETSETKHNNVGSIRIWWCEHCKRPNERRLIDFVPSKCYNAAMDEIEQLKKELEKWTDS